ncbi:hypothetical protein GA0115240_15341, partial [Streptomyces sp. DvalAA-14]
MMYAAGDWWLSERPVSRDQLVRSLADLRVGAPGRGRRQGGQPGAVTPGAPGR